MIMEILELVKRRDPGEVEFHQAVSEVMESIAPALERNPEYRRAGIVERMVEGRINKFYKEVCLNEQIFVKDSDKTVKDILGDVKVTAFTRYQLGEGIEKKQENFAAEVAAQMK